MSDDKARILRGITCTHRRMRGAPCSECARRGPPWSRLCRVYECPDCGLTWMTGEGERG